MSKKLFYILFFGTLIFSCQEEDEKSANQEPLTANEWELVSEYTRVEYNGKITESLSFAGDLVTDSTIQSIHCAGGTSIQEEVIEAHRINYQYFNYRPDSSFTISTSTFYKEFDLDNSTCETGVLYTETTKNIDIDGKWSYDENQKTITINYLYDSLEISATNSIEFQGNYLIFINDGSDYPDRQYYTKTTLRVKE